MVVRPLPATPRHTRSDLMSPGFASSAGPSHKSGPHTSSLEA